MFARRRLAPEASRPWLPSLCAVCADFGSGRVCAACVQRFASDQARCPRCAMHLPTAAAAVTQAAANRTIACADCLRDPPIWAQAICATDYNFPWDRLIVDLKFHAQVELATPLAQRLALAVLARSAPATVPIDIVLPVPLAAARLAERGFNQAWEIARRVARQLQLPADATLLLRPLETAHQADLPRAERAKNLRGAFMVAPRRHAELQGRRIAIVDDVLTTGATAREATAALLRAGAASVQVWTVARTA
jgi:ComF family protein